VTVIRRSNPLGQRIALRHLGDRRSGSPTVRAEPAPATNALYTASNDCACSQATVSAKACKPDMKQGA
jgi:hypothetical protein